MPNNNPNIPAYSAADLLRYATGQMTASEMHAVEKAALEDPFLAEALEGYVQATETQLPLQTSINKLNLPAAQKETGKIIPLWRKKAFQYAVAAVFVVGGAWFTYSLINSPNAEQQTSAIASKKADDKIAASDTDVVSSATLSDAPVQQAPAAVDRDAYGNFETDKVAEDYAVEQQRPVEKKEKTSIIKDSVVMERADNTNVAMNDVAKNEVKNAPLPLTPRKTAPPATETASEAMPVQRQQSGTLARAKSTNNAETRNVFRGRITDTKNNPLPYANVMISGENIGTYTDSKGNFNLTYDDSILPVRTRSLGYESQVVQMKPGNGEQQIIMPEDEKLKESLSVVAQKPRAKQVGLKPLIIETDSLSSAQPVVGLIDYNTYLLNNNRISELPQASRSVELSFEVDKRGEVKNITVEQSSGKELDAEAIRLLKEGPKWKSNKGGTSRARVKVKL